jgi:hypothetical protein
MKDTSEKRKNIMEIGGRMVAGFFNSYFRSWTLRLTTAHACGTCQCGLNWTLTNSDGLWANRGERSFEMTGLPANVEKQPLCEDYFLLSSMSCNRVARSRCIV